METPDIGTTTAVASTKERPNQRERRDGGDRGEEPEEADGGEETGETHRPISWLFLPDRDNKKTRRGNRDKREEMGEMET